MTRVSASELTEQVATAQKDKHDTLYCNPSHARKLIDEVSEGVMHSRTGTVSRILGLKIIEIPRLERVIVCEKGEVFPLAKDWKE